MGFLSLGDERKFQIEDAILILLLLLSLGGIIITDFSPLDGYTYWMVMVIVFALLAILIAWLQDKEQVEDEFSSIVKEQALHWLSSMATIGGVFLLEKADVLTETTSSPVMLLILALATILDGIRIGWRFSLVGVYLGVAAIIIAYSDHFLLVNSLLAILIVAFTISLEIWLARRAI